MSLSRLSSKGGELALFPHPFPLPKLDFWRIRRIFSNLVGDFVNISDRISNQFHPPCLKPEKKATQLEKIKIQVENYFFPVGKLKSGCFLILVVLLQFS